MQLYVANGREAAAMWVAFGIAMLVILSLFFSMLSSPSRFDK